MKRAFTIIIVICILISLTVGLSYPAEVKKDKSEVKNPDNKQALLRDPGSEKTKVPVEEDSGQKTSDKKEAGVEEVGIEMPGIQMPGIQKTGIHNVGIRKSKVTVRIKDIAYIQGTNKNQLIGYGLVTGLRGTGDKTKTISNVMLGNMFENLGIKISNSEMQRLQTKNVAVVMVTAELPASFMSGDAIDVTVSSIGDARSLEGGVLIFSMLKGPDSKVYASAQGMLTVGLEGGGSKRGSAKKALVGRIPDGGLICRNMDVNLIKGGKMTWVLRNPDSTTVTRVAKAINRKMGGMTARTRGNRFIVIDMSRFGEDAASIVGRIGELEVIPDTRARVVVNERTGTVVMGERVKILPVVISHGNLTLSVENKSKGSKQSTQKKGRLIKLGGDATVRDVIEVLNYIGANSNDIITILQALKNAGALQGGLEVI
ncbi:MAG: flagellar basal body P-ring protein FlgI [Candidatus Eremiobacteraeota bacterium]|nr:flagellar basal body P-ring protein FlgI [Candidatus Eremiobacteraeota bacterium]